MGKFFYENQAHKANLPMLCGNYWVIRLIAALLLTFMSHIRPVPPPQGDLVWSPQTMRQVPHI